MSSNGQVLVSEFHLQFSIAPVLIGLTGVFLAMWLYKKENNKPEKIAASFSGIYKAASHKFYFDELYLFITHKVIFNFVGRPAAWFDKNVVNGLVNATGNTTEAFSRKIKGIQSGKVQNYAIYFLIATIAMAVLFIYWWK